jgi:hypothetical protein
VHVTEGTIMANYYNPKLATGIYVGDVDEIIKELDLWKRYC